MKIVTGLFISILLPVVVSKDCEPGGPCVWLFQGPSCGELMTSYTPDCSGHCYVYPFDCIAMLNDDLETTCVTYSDDQCTEVLDQNLAAEGGENSGFTWNVVLEYPVSTPGGQSMQCYNGCHNG